MLHRAELLAAAHDGLVFGAGGWWIHDTAEVDPSAIIFPGAYIGPNVKIGEDCVVGPNTSIGQPGFGYDTDDTGERNYRTHTKGVIINDDVHIGANTCIDQGRHRPTEIFSGTRIDNLVHIAHNVIIGHRCLVIAHVMIAGSCEIGDDVQISPGAQICDHVKVGDGAHIGLGAVVLKDVPAGEVWVGNPARKLR